MASESKGDERLRYFVDTEFIEDGKTIDLISIAIVADDGRELYLCNADCDLSRAGDWVREHVIPLLPERRGGLWSDRWMGRSEIAAEVRDFVRPVPKAEFWAYYADYDWVALCQLFGRMIDLPDHFPRLCMDIKQFAVMTGHKKLPKQVGREHDALYDARWNQEVFHWLNERAEARAETLERAVRASHVKLVTLRGAIEHQQYEYARKKCEDFHELEEAVAVVGTHA